MVTLRALAQHVALDAQLLGHLARNGLTAHAEYSVHLHAEAGTQVGGEYAR